MLTSEPVGAATPVTVTTSDAAVASLEGAVVIPAGQRSASITVRTGVAGTATLTFRVDGEVRQFTVIVGQPSATDIPLTFAKPVGARLFPVPMEGLLFAGRTMQRTIVIPLLESAQTGTTTVTISSSDPNVASVLDTVTIPAESLSATLTVATGVDGVATLRLRLPRVRSATLSSSSGLHGIDDADDCGASRSRD